MKCYRLALAWISILPALASAQGNRPATPEMPAQAPAASGTQVAPDATTGSGMVRVPPPTDSKAVTTPPKNVDPAMDDATGRIDRKNKEKADPKGTAPARGKPGEKGSQEYK